MGPACGTHEEEEMLLYRFCFFVAVIDRLEELVVDGIGPP